MYWPQINTKKIIYNLIHFLNNLKNQTFIQILRPYVCVCVWCTIARGWFAPNRIDDASSN